jgi:hypothetical protein
MGELGSQWTDFSKILHLNIFRKIVKFQITLTRTQGTLRKNQSVFLSIFCSVFLRTRNVVDRNVVDKKIVDRKVVDRKVVEKNF